MPDRIQLTENKIHMINYHDDSITLKIDEVNSIDYIQLKKQFLDDHDIISNLGVNPRQLIQDWKEKIEKWDKIIDSENPHDGVCNVEINIILQQENKKLKENYRNLQFRFNDEQDEINRINGEWRKDIQIVKRIKTWQKSIEKESNNPIQEKNHSFQPSAINYYLKEILGGKND